jgi:subfamily B ATP-binding cassette protein MsbA
MRDELKLSNLSFAYRADESAVIKSLSTCIKQGQMVAVVGPSGSGKSTLMAIIARFFDPQEGAVLVDGVDLRQLDVRSWRRRLAMVGQDTFIFNDTVANNISFGSLAFSREKIISAAKLASADEFIENLPQGYDTVLGDRGIRLSGGQQQRISIARAVFSDPEILILDEATSHLDTFAERAIQNAIERMSKDRTVLVVAHRLSTVRKADRVIVLQEGRIVEEGSHQALLKQRGRYWDMVMHQQLELVSDETDGVAAELLG